MMNISALVLSILFLSGFLCQNRRFSWKMSDLWSSCSKTCGLGSNYKLIICVRKTLYGSQELVENDKCLNSKKPTERIMKSCFYGKCPDKKINEYVWKVSEWSTCSKSCGGNGIRTRDVLCTLVLKSGGRLEALPSNCMASMEPNKSEKCAFNDCPPEFVTTPWDKCTKVRECRPGIRRRKMKCIVTFGNSKSTQVSAGHCYRLGKPPVGWEHCIYDPNYQEKCKFKKEIEKKKIPIIISNNSTMHQMRKVNKIQLMIGQIAYILPHTILVIKCQVENYPASSLIWTRNNETYSYRGKIDSRISVTRRGSLIIKKFLLTDKGIWYCKAKDVSSSINLLVKSPSEGFEDWIFRHIYRKENIVNIKNDVQYIKAVSYQWVVGFWSACSRSCGEEGVQRRRVDCEKLVSHYYIIVNETQCNDLRFKKPNDTRSCNGMKFCPEWVVLEDPSSKCSNNCININEAILDSTIHCTFKDKILPDSGCNTLQKPSLKCFNKNCDVYWKTGIWSKCSKSCGKFGMRSRTINCLWKTTNISAGSLCYKKGLQIPSVISKCIPPPCQLGCVDLSKYCGSKNMCWNNRYRFVCCKTCIKY